jgi:hypothetical protein
MRSSSSHAKTAPAQLTARSLRRRAARASRAAARPRETDTDAVLPVGASSSPSTPFHMSYVEFVNGRFCVADVPNWGRNAMSPRSRRSYGSRYPVPKAPGTVNAGCGAGTLTATGTAPPMLGGRPPGQRRRCASDRARLMNLRVIAITSIYTIFVVWLGRRRPIVNRGDRRMPFGIGGRCRDR